MQERHFISYKKEYKKEKGMKPKPSQKVVNLKLGISTYF